MNSTVRDTLEARPVPSLKEVTEEADAEDDL